MNARLANLGEEFLGDEVGRRLFGQRGRERNWWPASKVFVGRGWRRTFWLRRLEQNFVWRPFLLMRLVW